MGLLISDDSLRAMYRGGQANATARRLARLWALVFGLGLAPRRWVALEVPGRRSGRLLRFPLGMARWDGHWYLVPMLGGECNWVRNVRAAHGRVALRRRGAVACRLVELPANERPPIIKSFLQQVPGARPHIPVDARAPVAEFEAISPRYPVFRVCRDPDPGRAPGKRHWRRWIIAGVLAFVALALLAIGLAVKLQPTPPPLALPPGGTGAPTGPINGTWHVAAGSVAGFRVPESFIGMTNDVVGRTKRVTGAIVVSDSRVTAAALRIDLATIKVNGKTQPQFAKSLDTASEPVATFALARPVALPPALASGAIITVTATGRLTMHGVSRLVTFTITGRRDGSALQAVGSIPVTFSAWGITDPAGYSFLGSLASHGAAEFLVVLHRSGSAGAGG
jgi:polyisoprenoid-binding protein YceI